MGEFRRKAREMGCHVKQTEPYTPWSNATEATIREVKRGAGRKMTKTQTPSKLWDHCLELEGYIRSHTAINSFELQGQVPETVLSGQTADISPFVELPWYGWVYYWDSKAQYPESKEKLGRWLGPSIDIGPPMTAKVLKPNGQLLHVSTYRLLSDDEMQDPGEKRKQDQYDSMLRTKLGKPLSVADLEELGIHTPEYELYEDDHEGGHQHAEDAEDLVTDETGDQYIGAEVSLPKNGQLRTGKVIRRQCNDSGDLIGKANQNPILDMRSYQVQCPNGEIAPYAANLIAENMITQCDPDGNQFLLLESITDHNKDQSAVPWEDRYVTINGRQHHRITTKGWKLCVTWRDGTSSWERLSDLKESYPIQVAEYAVGQDLTHEPAFTWWVQKFLRKRDHIVSTVKQRYAKRSHKFGIEVPRMVKRALEIDRENGNSLWREAITKEMAAVRVAFKLLDDRQNPPPGHSYMDCHMIFDIKLDGFRHKARLVAGGHMVETPPPIMTYASVVSRDTIRIALTIAALNDLQVKASDVQNAFLIAPCEEKIWTKLGPEFGVDAGKSAILTRALYGLKSAGASFGNHVADCMRTLGYLPCKADPDLWYKSMVHPEDNFKYYAYMLLYVDDCLAIHRDAETALTELDNYFAM